MPTHQDPASDKGSPRASMSRWTSRKTKIYISSEEQEFVAVAVVVEEEVVVDGSDEDCG
jgi:hypothetical protein